MSRERRESSSPKLPPLRLTVTPLVAQVLRVASIMKDGEEDQEPQKHHPHIP